MRPAAVAGRAMRTPGGVEGREGVLGAWGADDRDEDGDAEHRADLA